MSALRPLGDLEELLLEAASPSSPSSDLEEDEYAVQKQVRRVLHRKRAPVAATSAEPAPRVLPTSRSTGQHCPVGRHWNETLGRCATLHAKVPGSSSVEVRTAHSHAKTQGEKARVKDDATHHFHAARASAETAETLKRAGFTRLAKEHEQRAAEHFAKADQRRGERERPRVRVRAVMKGTRELPKAGTREVRRDVGTRGLSLQAKGTRVLNREDFVGALRNVLQEIILPLSVPDSHKTWGRGGGSSGVRGVIPLQRRAVSQMLSTGNLLYTAALHQDLRRLPQAIGNVFDGLAELLDHNLGDWFTREGDDAPHWRVSEAKQALRAQADTNRRTSLAQIADPGELMRGADNLHEALQALHRDVSSTDAMYDGDGPDTYVFSGVWFAIGLLLALREITFGAYGQRRALRRELYRESVADWVGWMWDDLQRR